MKKSLVLFLCLACHSVPTVATGSFDHYVDAMKNFLYIVGRAVTHFYFPDYPDYSNYSEPRVLAFGVSQALNDADYYWNKKRVSVWVEKTCAEGDRPGPEKVTAAEDPEIDPSIDVPATPDSPCESEEE